MFASQRGSGLRVRSLILSFLLSAFAAPVLAQPGTVRLDKYVPKETAKAHIFYALKDIPAGTVLSETDIEDREVNKLNAPGDAVNSKQQLVGKKLVKKILMAQIFSVRDVGLPITKAMEQRMIVRDYSKSTERKGRVVFAKNPIAEGVVAKEQYFGTAEIPSDLIPQDALTSASLVAGRKLRYPVIKFQIIGSHDISNEN